MINCEPLLKSQLQYMLLDEMCVCVTVVTKHAAACVNACVFDGAMVVKALADLGFSGPLYSLRLLLSALQLVVD